MRNKTLTFSIILILLISTGIKASEMVLKGIYQGKDLYIINPMLDMGEEYCAYEVFVNKIEFENIINSSAFRISLDYAGLEFGQEYEVVIKHHENCTPKLVNPEVLKPLSTYNIANYELGYNNMMSFTTQNESGKLTFYIEEFRWNKWILRGSIPGEGGPDNRTYSQKTYPYNGENMFRIYQMDHLNRKFYSDTIIFNITKEAVTVTCPLNKVKNEISLSAITYYAVINKYGEELITGSGNMIDVSDLKKGEYFLNFEDEYIVFKKR